MKTCVVTVANRQERYYQQFMTSAVRAGIFPYVLGVGESYEGNLTKIRLIKRFLPFARSFYSHLLFVDAFDCVFVHGLDRIEMAYSALKSPIVFSADRACWPDEGLAPQFPGRGRRYPFLNSGIYIGEIAAVESMLSTLNLEIENPRQSDQLLFIEAFVAGRIAATIDYDCRIVFSMNFAEEDLQFRNGKIVNSVTGSEPAVIHGSGGVDMSTVVAWLDLPSDR